MSLLSHFYRNATESSVGSKREVLSLRKGPLFGQPPSPLELNVDCWVITLFLNVMERGANRAMPQPPKPRHVKWCEAGYGRIINTIKALR